MVSCSSILALTLALFRHANGRAFQAHEATPPSADAVEESASQAFNGSEPIAKKPTGDHRSYQYARLANGLEVVSVQDAATKMAAIGVAVDAGSYYDPSVHYGLAHMTEHSMFLGSKKYPGVAEFDEFLAAHGGESNAYTANEATVYYGSMDVAGFHDGMAHFADMLGEPLLRKDSIWKETSAVLSEHEKNIDDPGWYSQRAMLNIADPGNPIQYFHTGDNGTLKNYGAANLSSEIQSYVKKNYCPPRMHLVTFSSDSVFSQLSRANATFGAIPRLGVSGACSAEKRDFAKPSPFPKERLQKFLLVEGSQPSSTLLFLFPLSDLRQMKDSHPSYYVDYVMNYGGKGSLTLVLRDQLRLAGDISFSVEHSSAGSMLWIGAGLTPIGAKKPQAVIDVILTFLQSAKRHCTKEVVTSLAKSSKIFWDWPSSAEKPTDAVSDIAEVLTRDHFQEVLAADSLTDSPNETSVSDLIGMMHPERMNVALVAPDVAKLWDNTSDVKVLAHYGNRYNVSNFDDWFSNWKCWGSSESAAGDNTTKSCGSLAQRLKDENISFSGDINMVLPGVIKDLHDNMSVSHAKAGNGTDLVSHLYGGSPNLIQENKTMELWFRKGWVSAEPRVKASFFLRAKRPSSYTSSARDVVLSRLCMGVADDEIDERLADIALTGFEFSVSQSMLGVSVSVSGFSPTLFKHTDRMLKDFTTALDVENNVTFHRNLGQLMYGFLDNSDEPVRSAETDLKILLTPRTHSKQELYDAVSNGPEITFADARHTCENARKGPFQATSLVMGNYANDEATKLYSRFLASFSAPMTIKSDEVERITPMVMPLTPTEIRRQNRRPGDQNHVTIVNILVGTASVENRVLLGIVSSIYSQVVFAELRTMKELGYVVGGEVSEMSTVMTISCYVQGEKMLPDNVEQECEHVMAVTVPRELAVLSDTVFLSHKDSFKSALLEGPLSSQDQKDHFEDPILLGGCENLRVAMLSFLETITSKDQLVEAWKHAVMPVDAVNSSHVLPRKKVVVKYFGNGSPVSAAPSVDETKLLLANASLNGSIAERVLKERAITRVLSDSNSTLRESLVKDGGYYPVVLDCTWNPQAATSGSSAKDTSVIVDSRAQGKTNRSARKGHADESSHAMATISPSGMKAFMRSETRKASISRHRSGKLDDEIVVEESGYAHHGESQATSSSHRPHLAKKLHHPLLRPRPAATSFAEVEKSPKSVHFPHGARPRPYWDQRQHMTSSVTAYVRALATKM